MFDNEHDMNVKEAFLVTEEFCGRQDTYNMCPGGKGGFGYLNNHQNAKEWKIKAGKSVWRNEEFVKKHKKLMSDKWKKMHIEGNMPPPPTKTMLGKSHSEKTKQKIAKSAIGKHSDWRNSQYGTIWITNGKTIKKIKKLDSIPKGWYKGKNIHNTIPNIHKSLTICHQCKVEAKVKEIYIDYINMNCNSLSEYVRQSKYNKTSHNLNKLFKKYIFNYNSRSN